jgi:hypothetical protein
MSAGEFISDRERILRELAQQMQQYHIAPDELSQTLNDITSPPVKPLPTWFVFYVPALVLALLLVFLHEFWDNLAPTSRIVLTLGVGMLLHLPAIMLWSQRGRLWAGQGLLLLAVGLQSIGWFALFHHLVPTWQPEGGIALIALPLMFLQSALLWRVYRHGFLLFYPAVFAYALSLIGLHALGAHPIAILLALGASMLCLSQLILTSRYATQSIAWQALGLSLLYYASFKLLQTSAPIFLLLSMFGMGFGIRKRLPAIYILSAVTAAIAVIHGIHPWLLGSSLWAFTLVLEALLLSAFATALKCLSFSSAPAICSIFLVSSVAFPPGYSSAFILAANSPSSAFDASLRISGSGDNTATCGGNRSVVFSGPLTHHGICLSCSRMDLPICCGT